MKSRIALFLTAALLALMLVGCGAKNGYQENIAAQKENVWQQWEYCLKTHELVYDTMRLALDEVQIGSEDLNWDSLLRARAMVSSAKLRLTNVILTGREVDEADYMALLKAGLEPELVLTEYEKIEEIFQQNLLILNHLENMLMSDIWLTYNAEYMEVWMEFCQALVTSNCEYLCLTTNYLMLQWDNSEKWQETLETYPTIASAADSWCDDPEQLTADRAEILESISQQQEMETIFYDELITDYTYFVLELARMQGLNEKYAASAYENIQDDMVTMHGAVTFFPLPNWLPEELITIYMDNEDSESRTVRLGEKIEPENILCWINCDGIEKVEVQVYTLLLKTFGMTVNEYEEEDYYQILCENGDCKLNVTWERGKTTIYLPAPVGCMVPDWYLATLQTNQNN